MVKFKVGDRVERISTPEIFRPTVKAGQRFTVEEVTSNGYLRFSGFITFQDPKHYKKVDTHTIVITTDGDTGSVKYIQNGNKLKDLKLIRQKEDRHDLKMLAAYAVQKLFPDDGNIISVHKAGYTGAVAVINSKNKEYRDGKIIEFIGGKCTSGLATWEKFDDLKSVQKFFKSPRHYNFDVVELHRN